MIRHDRQPYPPPSGEHAAHLLKVLRQADASARKLPDDQRLEFLTEALRNPMHGFAVAADVADAIARKFLADQGAEPA